MWAVNYIQTVLDDYDITYAESPEYISISKAQALKDR
jgi:hypothetical protein